VWCLFPEEEKGRSTVSNRAHPALILEVFEEQDGWSVKVAPGTSQNLDKMYSGEFTVECAYAESGLTKDTKFKLGSSINLAYTDMHFIVIKGKTPKIGDLPRNQIIGRRFVAAAKNFY
jgi:hypothetical protein